MDSNNPVSEYLLKRMKEIRPDDNMYQLSKRTGIPRATLHNRFYKSKEWEQSILLMIICGDLNITMEEALSCGRIKEPKSEIISRLEKENHKLQKEVNALKSLNESLSKRVEKIQEFLKK